MYYFSKYARRAAREPSPHRPIHHPKLPRPFRSRNSTPLFKQDGQVLRIPPVLQSEGTNSRSLRRVQEVEKRHGGALVA